MSESGEYTLFVDCDRRGCNKAENFTPMSDVFTRPTRMEAIAAARSAGWMITHNRGALCPDHAIEKRTQRREIKA